LFEWLLKFLRSPETPSQTKGIDVYKGHTHIGTLYYTGKEYLFSYASNGNEGVRIPGLPDNYRSELLHPFFASRIPSKDRPEVREILREKNISENDILLVLCSVGAKSPISPYEFRIKIAA
jgi:hypothetical protein